MTDNGVGGGIQRRDLGGDRTEAWAPDPRGIAWPDASSSQDHVLQTYREALAPSPSFPLSRLNSCLIRIDQKDPSEHRTGIVVEG